MKWTEVDFNEINLKDRKRGGKSITYSSLENALRFQIPTGLSRDGLIDMYDKYYIDISVPDEFREWWTKLENYIGATRSCIRDSDSFRARVDVHTEVYDYNSKLTFEDLREGYLHGEVTLLIEVECLYDLGTHTGLSVRVHQIKHNQECLL